LFQREGTSLTKYKFFRIHEGLEPAGEGEGADENHALELAGLAHEPDIIAVRHDQVPDLVEEEEKWLLGPMASLSLSQM
jgi:hypothetical protein